MKAGCRPVFGGAAAALLLLAAVGTWLVIPRGPRRLPTDFVRSPDQAAALARAYFDRVIGPCGSLGEGEEDDHSWRYATHVGMGGFPAGFLRVLKQTGEVSMPGRPLLNPSELARPSDPAGRTGN